eukprot:5957529-Alexandrium_andersonii.AAC.3
MSGAYCAIVVEPLCPRSPNPHSLGGAFQESPYHSTAGSARSKGQPTGPPRKTIVLLTVKSRER